MVIPPGKDVRLLKTVVTIPEQLKKENSLDTDHSNWKGHHLP
jgi:hypothetical protein